MPDLPDFALSKRILRYYFNDGFFPVIVYGELRAGKSAYAMKTLIQVLNYLHNWKIDYRRIRKYWGFHPEDVIETWLTQPQEKDPVYIWDDAGFWLHSMEWHDPLLITIQKYLNVIGTDYGCLILTTPDPSWVLSKFSTLHGMIRVKIVRARGDDKINVDEPPSTKFARLAIGYKPYKSPDFKKHGVNKVLKDEFSCKIPDEIYSEYKPERDKYAMLAKLQMRDALHTKLKLQNLNSMKLDRRIDTETKKATRRSKKETEQVERVNQSQEPDIVIKIE